jgi:hypothetical protein
MCGPVEDVAAGNHLNSVPRNCACIQHVHVHVESAC